MIPQTPQMGKHLDKLFYKYMNVRREKLSTAKHNLIQHAGQYNAKNICAM